MHEYRRFVQTELDKRGWTPGRLARMAGMHRQTISKILKDEREHLGQMPEGSTMEGIARGFNIDVERVRLAAARSLAGYVEDPTRPQLPRSAPQAPAMGQLDRALGAHPNFGTSGAASMPADERALLISARNKLVHKRSELTEEETAVLTKFIEDDELNQLHVRIDWLPRAEQLEVSALVNDLHVRYLEMEQEEGVTCETEAWDLPERLRANPLPYQGERPDLSMYERPGQVSGSAPGAAQVGSLLPSSLASPEFLGKLNDIAVHLDLSEKLDELRLMASVLPASYEKDAGLLRGLHEFVNTAKESATDVVISHEYPHLRENLDQLSEQISTVLARAAHTWTPPFAASPVDQFNEHFGINQPGREQA